MTLDELIKKRNQKRSDTSNVQKKTIDTLIKERNPGLIKPNITLSKKTENNLSSPLSNDTYASVKGERSLSDKYTVTYKKTVNSNFPKIQSTNIFDTSGDKFKQMAFSKQGASNNIDLGQSLQDSKTVENISYNYVGYTPVEKLREDLNNNDNLDEVSYRLVTGDTNEHKDVKDYLNIADKNNGVVPTVSTYSNELKLKGSDITSIADSFEKYDNVFYRAVSVAQKDGKLSDSLNDEVINAIDELKSKKGSDAEISIANEYISLLEGVKNGSYVKYLGGRFVQGEVSPVLNSITGAAVNVGDTVSKLTGSETESDKIKKISDFFASKPEKMSQLNTQGALFETANDIGVSVDDLNAYKFYTLSQHGSSEVEKESNYLNETVKEMGGDLFETTGSFLTNAILGAALGGSASNSHNGLLGNIVNKESFKKTLTDAFTLTPQSAVYGLSTAGSETVSVAQKRGYDPSNILIAGAKGYTEALSENLSGITNTDWFNLKSNGKSYINALFNHALESTEEVFEEEATLVAHNFIDKISTDINKTWFGSGGVFDPEEMFSTAVVSFAFGEMVGSVKLVSDIRSVSQNKKLSKLENTQVLSTLEKINDDLPEQFRAKISGDDIDGISKKILKAQVKYLKSLNDNIADHTETEKDIKKIMNYAIKNTVLSSGTTKQAAFDAMSEQGLTPSEAMSAEMKKNLKTTDLSETGLDESTIKNIEQLMDKLDTAFASSWYENSGVVAARGATNAYVKGAAVGDVLSAASVANRVFTDESISEKEANKLIKKASKLLPDSAAVDTTTGTVQERAARIIEAVENYTVNLSERVADVSRDYLGDIVGDMNTAVKDTGVKLNEKVSKAFTSLLIDGKVNENLETVLQDEAVSDTLSRILGTHIKGETDVEYIRRKAKSMLSVYKAGKGAQYSAVATFKHNRMKTLEAQLKRNGADSELILNGFRNAVYNGELTVKQAKAIALNKEAFDLYVKATAGKLTVQSTIDDMIHAAGLVAGFDLEGKSSPYYNNGIKNVAESDNLVPAGEVGIYDPETGEVVLNKNADPQKKMAYLLAHELLDNEEINVTDNKQSYSFFDDVISIDNESQSNIKSRNEYIITNHEQLSEHIDNSLSNKDIKCNCHIGAINQLTLDRIKKACAEDVFKKGQYTFRITSDSIRHIAEHFLGNAKIEEAVYRLYDTVNNYDDVNLVYENGEKRLVFEKSYDDYNFRAVVIASKKKRCLGLVTFFATKNNKKIKAGIQNPANTQITSELASRDVPTYINILSDKETNVNNNSVKGNLVRIKKRNIQAGESTSPINADYGMNVSEDIVSQTDNDVNIYSIQDLEKYSSRDAESARDVLSYFDENLDNLSSYVKIISKEYDVHTPEQEEYSGDVPDPIEDNSEELNYTNVHNFGKNARYGSALVDSILEYMENNFYDIDSLIEKAAKKYNIYTLEHRARINSAALSPENLQAEVAADFLTDLFSNAELMNKFVDNDIDLAVEISECIKDFADTTTDKQLAEYANVVYEEMYSLFKNDINRIKLDDALTRRRKSGLKYNALIQKEEQGRVAEKADLNWFEKKKKEISDVWQDTYRQVVDSAEAFARLGEELGLDSVYPLLNNIRQSRATAEVMLTKHMVDIYGKVTGESLMDIYKPILKSGKAKAFDDYLRYLDNSERFKNGNQIEGFGSSQEDCLYRARLLEKNNPEFKKNAEKVYKYIDNLMHWLIEVGALTEEEYAKMREKNKYYVPAFPDLEGDTDSSYFVRSVVLSKGVKKAYGGDYVTMSVLEALAVETNRVVYNSRCNRLMSTVFTELKSKGLIQNTPEGYEVIDPSIIKFINSVTPTENKQVREPQNVRGVYITPKTNAKLVDKLLNHFSYTNNKGDIRNTIKEYAKKITLHEAYSNVDVDDLISKLTDLGAVFKSDVKSINELFDEYIRAAKQERAEIEKKYKETKYKTFDPEKLDNFKFYSDEQEGNCIVFYIDGVRHVAKVGRSLYEGFKHLNHIPDANKADKYIKNANTIYKKLLTSWKPGFAIRNGFRDIGSAWLNSDSFWRWLWNYIPAYKQILNKGEFFTEFEALGGVGGSYLDFDRYIQLEIQDDTANKVKKAASLSVATISRANEVVELAPRVAEYMAQKKSGKSSLEALHAAADVTVNFARAGITGKRLNSTFVPFLNPSIQGADKFFRLFKEKKTGRALVWFAVRLLSLGFLGRVINDFVHELSRLWLDEEDEKNDTYDQLTDYQKQNNLLIPIGDGRYLKIPKGREIVAISVIMDGAWNAIKGEKVNWFGVIKASAEQILPENPITNNLLSGIYDAMDGKTWYGEDIVEQGLAVLDDELQFDETTSRVAIALGKLLGYSPKKIDYIIDQYLGFPGDIITSITTSQGGDDILENIGLTLISDFVLDAKSSNRVSSDYYTLMDDLNSEKKDYRVSDTLPATVSHRFMNSFSTELEKLYDEISAINAGSLSPNERANEIRKVKVEITSLMLKVMSEQQEVYEASVGFESKYAYEKNGLYYDEEGDELTYDAYIDVISREVNREVFGAEYALQNYNKDTYEKAVEAVENGATYDLYYNAYFDTKSIEGDIDYKKGTIKSGTARKNKWKYINTMDASRKEKAALARTLLDIDDKKIAKATAKGISEYDYIDFLCDTGAFASDDDSTKKEKVLAYINKMDLSSRQKDSLYLLAGYSEKTIYNVPWR